MDRCVPPRLLQNKWLAWLPRITCLASVEARRKVKRYSLEAGEGVSHNIT